jgi:hypothetical protein
MAALCAAILFWDLLLLFTAITDQMNYKKNFERFALQIFQNSSWLGFECKAL